MASLQSEKWAPLDSGSESSRKGLQQLCGLIWPHAKVGQPLHVSASARHGNAGAETWGALLEKSW